MDACWQPLLQVLIIPGMRKWVGALPAMHLYSTENNQIELSKFFVLSSERKILESEQGRHFSFP